jgi:hypothetical protein
MCHSLMTIDPVTPTQNKTIPDYCDIKDGFNFQLFLNQILDWKASWFYLLPLSRGT